MFKTPVFLKSFRRAKSFKLTFAKKFRKKVRAFVIFCKSQKGIIGVYAYAYFSILTLTFAKIFRAFSKKGPGFQVL